MDITVNMYLLQFHYFNTRDLLFFLSFFFFFHAMLDAQTTFSYKN